MLHGADERRNRAEKVNTHGTLSSRLFRLGTLTVSLTFAPVCF